MSDTPGQDVVAVFDADGNQVFTDARPIRALIRQGSKFAKHPVETGGEITDNRVILPVSIELSLILTPDTLGATFQTILDLYTNAAPLSVQTKVTVYDDLYIEEMPHDENAEQFDTVGLGLRLTQVIFVDAQFTAAPPAAPADKSTVKTGQKTGADADGSQTSAAFALIHGSG